MSVASSVRSPTSATQDFEHFTNISESSDTRPPPALSNFTHLDENGLPLSCPSFTPTRYNPKPRAWERQKSTPFAPRTDAQKIWKRVPLQNVTSAINATWRREITKGDGIMRPVKRMRIGGAHDLEDKENVDYIAVKWDASPEGSPRRRAPASQLHDCSATSTSPLAAKRVMATSPTMSFEIAADLVDPAILIEEKEGTLASSSRYDILVSKERASRTEQESSMPSQQGAGDASHSTTAELLEEADIFLRTSPQRSPTNAVAEPVPSAYPTSTSEASAWAETQSSVSDEELSFVGPAPAQPQPLSVVTYNDPDDTSYLQDFLLRSKAQKAEKLDATAPIPTKAEEGILTEAFVPREDTDISYLMTTFQVEPPTLRSPAAEVEAQEEETEAKASSPCRRSSRLTRLPRPQKPSTLLTLRRLNGGEFIAMQRETQSLATTTRVNTRKNRDTAIPVQARLVQLKAEPKPTEEERPPSTKAKSVSWSELLARFQDYTGPPLSSSAETEMKGPPAPVPDEVQELEDEQDKQPVKEVKKRRKERVGSVNGTPAPKRSIEILLEDAARTTGQNMTLASQYTGKRTRSKAKR